MSAITLHRFCHHVSCLSNTAFLHAEPFDVGAMHNASISRAGADPDGVPPWPADFWTLWKHPDNKTGGMSPAGCCTTAYTGLIALPGSDELVITYDMIARPCPKTVCPKNRPKGEPCGCDLIVSMKLETSTTSGDQINSDEE